jgi:hypothetical protein
MSVCATQGSDPLEIYSLELVLILLLLPQFFFELPINSFHGDFYEYCSRTGRRGE